MPRVRTSITSVPPGTPTPTSYATVSDFIGEPVSDQVMQMTSRSPRSSVAVFRAETERLEARYALEVEGLRQTSHDNVTYNYFSEYFLELENELITTYLNAGFFDRCLNSDFSISWRLVHRNRVSNRIVLRFIRIHRTHRLSQHDIDELDYLTRTYVPIVCDFVHSARELQAIIRDIVALTSVGADDIGSPPRHSPRERPSPTVQGEEFPDDSPEESPIHFRINNQKTMINLNTRNNNVQLVVTSERGTQGRAICTLFVMRITDHRENGICFRRLVLPNRIHGLTISRRPGGELVVTEVEKGD